MPKTIVIGYDRSEHAKRALSRAAELADGDSEVVVVAASAFRDPRIVHGPGRVEFGVLEHELSEEELAGCDSILAEAREVLAGSELKATYVEAFGDAGDAILKEARERSADLIVVGAHDHSRFDRLRPGSVIQKVTVDASVDVLVVH